jgi:hypothetical protein
MTESFLFFLALLLCAIVAFAGLTVIRSFAGSIKNMQGDNEAQWARDSAAESARVTAEKNQSAGGI